MANYDSNYAIAQEISARIGNAPIPFDSVYSIALQIYQELGGEESEFDSVYSILLGILPLAESVAKKTSITEVDKLPEANDNNDIYRLSSNDKVYMSVRYPDTMTNRLPDEQQIDKAFSWETKEDIYYYKGAWKIICSDGEVDGYGWLEYFPDSWYLIITQDDAVKTTINTMCFDFNYVDNAEDVDFDAHTVTLDVPISDYQWDNADNLIGYGIAAVVPAIYNAPEAVCIGNATCYSDAVGNTVIYQGTEETVTIGGVPTTVYAWYSESEDSYTYSTKKASEIYYYVNDSFSVCTDTLFVFDDGETDYIASMYIPQLNAPESEQISKAEIGNNQYQIDNYSGERTVTCSDGNVTVYLWGSLDSIQDAALTKIPASDIYTEQVKGLYQALSSLHWDDISTLTYDDTVKAFNDDFNTIAEDIPVENGIVKYQRTIENWQWKQIPTMDDLQPKEINIASTSATELAKLNDFMETGVYDSHTLKLTYLGYPANLIVGSYTQAGRKYTSQWIKYYNPQYFYSEYVYGRVYNHSYKQWENNPLGEYPRTLHEEE